MTNITSVLLRYNLYYDITYNTILMNLVKVTAGVSGETSPRKTTSEADEFDFRRSASGRRDGHTILREWYFSNVFVNTVFAL